LYLEVRYDLPFSFDEPLPIAEIVKKIVEENNLYELAKSGKGEYAEEVHAILVDIGEKPGEYDTVTYETPEEITHAILGMSNDNSKSEITYNRTMYVRVTDRDMFDSIANELYSFYAQGNDNLCIAWEELTSYIDDKGTDTLSPDARKFILEAHNNAEGEIGDVVFWYGK